MNKETLTALVDRFVNAPTWEECRQMVISNPELLSDAADNLLLANIRQYPADSREYKGLYESRSVLKKSRETGIESAFADRIIPLELKKVLQQLRDPANDENYLLRVELARRGLTMTSETLRPRIWAILQVYLGNALADIVNENRKEYVELAIESFNQALKVIMPEHILEGWGFIQANLGNAYMDRIAGNRAENIEKAIEYYTLSLKPLKESAPLLKWIKTMMNLGWAYQERIKGDRTENLKTAISLYQEVLSSVDRNAVPEEWAHCINKIGVAYWSRYDGNREDHIEKALSFFEQALEIRTREAVPEEWAESVINLGSAYFQRLKGNRSENLEKAVSLFESVLNEVSEWVCPTFYTKCCPDK
ncbi:MAG: tetratricopeptide repeat protein [Desulfobacteraceae bacterium]|nr:tetratricopeptide repeat protein [Desulfobacteraceae bacterium]